MQRKKILWLVSWYPNRNDWFDGDFIQRHAKAAAIHNDVHVIFVTDFEMEKDVEEVWNHQNGLTEQIIYFKRKTGFLKRSRKQLEWKNLYQKAVENYLKKNGKPDCVHVHVPWKAGLIALWIKRKYKLPYIVTEHWGIYNDVLEENFSSKPAFFKNLLKRIYQNTKAFISVSKFLAKGVESLVGKKADVIIPNVVDTNLFFYKAEKYPRFTFIHVSNMVPLKNVKGILDAFQNFLTETNSDVQLILIGNKDNEFVEYAEQSGLLNRSVFFKGEILYQQVAEEMQHSHCFILNSIMENSPCVIGEALCCGLPVIATNVGGIPELVNETNSKLIPSQNEKALTEAMKQVWTNYSAFNQKQIAQEAEKKFNYKTIAEKFDELYTTFC